MTSILQIGQSEKIFKAIEFAAHAHSGQLRKGTCIPYIVHPIDIMKILLRYTKDDDVVAAGILHDVIEDTPAEVSDLQREFGQRITDLVIGASEMDKSLSWEERKEHTINYLNETSDMGILMVTCADKLNNVQTLLEDYETSGSTIWTHFKRGYESQRWYYTELAKIYRRYANTSPLFTDYMEAVGKLFKTTP